MPMTGPAPGVYGALVGADVLFLRLEAPLRLPVLLAPVGALFVFEHTASMPTRSAG